MKWTVSFSLAAVVLVLCCITAHCRSRSTSRRFAVLDPFRLVAIGVILSSLILFVPIYTTTFKATDCGPVETIFMSVHNVIRLFVADGDFDFVVENLEGISQSLAPWYTGLFSFLFVCAPVLTFGFVISFFKNVSAYRRYLTRFHSDAFIFSELSEKSLALAKSIHDKKSKNRLFVFCNVYEKDENGCELAAKAAELGAVCFRKDLTAVNFNLHGKKSRLIFFAISEDPSENIDRALKIIEKMKYRANTDLFVFSSQPEAEALLSNSFNSQEENAPPETPVQIKVRRVNEVRSLINRILYEDGFEKIFGTARKEEGTKVINAMVIGMGQHGTQMAKALPWFCQMDGFDVRVDAFDLSPDAEKKFTALCPELMEFSGKTDIEGEARYTLCVHSGIDVQTTDFETLAAALPRPTYVFISLGNDQKNIAAAMKIRSLFQRMGCDPAIQAVVRDTRKKNALTGIKNFKKQDYRIDFVGDLKSSYSQEVIMDSEVEEIALQRHLKWGKESEFWQYDYNYKSSVASAIHRKMKELCNIPGINKVPEERSEEERWPLRILEHRRWNAYMRSEGYVYGGTVEKEGRDDLAKKHNCLVPFSQLPPKEQEKDDD